MLAHDILEPAQPGVVLHKVASSTTAKRSDDDMQVDRQRRQVRSRLAERFQHLGAIRHPGRKRGTFDVGADRKLSHF